MSYHRHPGSLSPTHFLASSLASLCKDFFSYSFCNHLFLSPPLCQPPHSPFWLLAYFLASLLFSFTLFLWTLFHGMSVRHRWASDWLASRHNELQVRNARQDSFSFSAPSKLWDVTDTRKNMRWELSLSAFMAGHFRGERQFQSDNQLQTPACQAISKCVSGHMMNIVTPFPQNTNNFFPAWCLMCTEFPPNSI